MYPSKEWLKNVFIHERQAPTSPMYYLNYIIPERDLFHGLKVAVEFRESVRSHRDAVFRQRAGDHFLNELFFFENVLVFGD